MQRSDVTCGQLDRVLRSLGFSCRLDEREPPGRIYEHKRSGALVFLPTFPDEDGVLDYHLATVRTTLDGFGISDPTAFDARLQEAG
jgi:hypothetical protein